MDYSATKQNYETANDWHAEKSMGFLWTKELERFLSLIPGKSPRVLDVGCGGSGRDIDQFLERDVRIEGLDYSHAAIEALKPKYSSLHFYEADMMNTGLQEASFDGVWACASVLNLTKEDAPKALVEFNRLLKHDGALFVSVKKGEGERMVPDKGGERFFSFYSESEIQKMVEGAGFLVTQIQITEAKGNAQPGIFEWISLYAKKI